MVKWEYAMYVINTTEANFFFENIANEVEHDGRATTTLRHLDEFGNDGWEVISTNFDNGTTFCMLKRPRD